MPRRKIGPCLVCASSESVLVYTIDNQRKAAVMYLCGLHGAPLVELMDAAGKLPPDEQIPLSERGRAPVERHQPGKPGRRQPAMVPLMNWTPPD